MTVDYADNWLLEFEYARSGLHMFLRSGWDVTELYRSPRNWMCVV